MASLLVAVGSMQSLAFIIRFFNDTLLTRGLASAHLLTNWN
jgi:hypothetical protein